MSIREAKIEDVDQIQFVRNAVKENTLSDPRLVTDDDCVEYMTKRGKGWVFQIDDRIVGFSIVDLMANNVWALFVHPDFEKNGIGLQLHDVMLNWYFSRTQTTLWLGTSSNTRAEGFYRQIGWIETGIHGKCEIKFEMTYHSWRSKKQIDV